MKKYKFEFWNGKNEESEIVKLHESLTEEEIEEVFKEWYFNQLDMAGIEGSWDEQK